MQILISSFICKNAIHFSNTSKKREIFLPIFSHICNLLKSYLVIYRRIGSLKVAWWSSSSLCSFCRIVRVFLLFFWLLKSPLCCVFFFFQKGLGTPFGIALTECMSSDMPSSSWSLFSNGGLICHPLFLLSYLVLFSFGFLTSHQQNGKREKKMLLHLFYKRA